MTKTFITLKVFYIENKKKQQGEIIIEGSVIEGFALSQLLAEAPPKKICIEMEAVRFG